ncbi:MAG: DUF4394 domain-containing protein [Phycisphaerales bacterium]|nr:MAG: DUF4394 domain-containing protein [Phycisphaerales bacterium]
MVSTGLTWLVASSAHAQFQLVGAEFRNPTFAGNTTLWDIDQATGAASNPREITADVSLGLSFGPDGRLYSFTDSFGSINGVPNNGALYTIDVATGAAAPVAGNLGLDAFGEGDLDFNPLTNELFISTSSGGTTALHTVDTTTGLASTIGAMDATNASGMAFQPGSGRLFLLDTTFAFPPTTSFFYEIDPASGATLNVVELGVPFGTVAGMAFHPVTGELYLADGDFNGTNLLYTIDLNTFDLSVIGETVPGQPPADLGGLAGLAFIPSPGAAALFALAGCLGARRRR